MTLGSVARLMVNSSMIYLLLNTSVSPASRHSIIYKLSYCLMKLFLNLIEIFKLSLWFSGCLQLLEILEISLNMYGPPGNFCIKCGWSTTLVSNHDKTGYRITHLRNWSPFFIFATVLCCAYHVFVIYLGKLVGSVHCIAGRSNANMSWIFLEIPPGISWKFVQLNL